MNLDWGFSVPGASGPIHLSRTGEGVARIQARDELDLAHGVGVAHALDRLVQMELVRLIGAGRLGECLRANPTTERVDVYMRRLGLAAYAAEEAARLDPGTLVWAEAYARGVNRVVEHTARPLELWVTGHRPDPWTVADTLATLKLMAFSGLAQSQGDTEKLLLQAVQAGAPPARLAKLLHPWLAHLDDETLEAVARVELVEGLVPPEVRAAGAPALRGSNNWAVHGSRTRSGKPLFACDPHLEVDRLPPLWYEVVGELPGDFRLGVTMPGLPGLVMGRSSRLAAGFTYGSMDMIDWFIEDCADGGYRVGSERRPFTLRRERVLRRGKPPLDLEVFESPRGVLEGDPRQPGLKLCMAWSGLRHGAAASLEAQHRLFAAPGVEAAREVLGKVAIASNWVLADRDGHIAFRQAGLLPIRDRVGLQPRLGWRAADEWKGCATPAQMVTCIDPPEGFLASANDRFQAPGQPQAITLCAGTYRAERIRALLRTGGPFDLADMERIQGDLRSLQAERYLTRLLPRLPPSAPARALAAWDFGYRVEAPEPLWFEAFYHRVLDRTMEGVFTPPVWKHVRAETGLVDDLHEFFDHALLSGDPDWFGGQDPDAALVDTLAGVLADPPPGVWGDRNRILMRNVFFDGRLPGMLGFDVGPIPIPGGRATPVQGRVFRARGRPATFVPSWRAVGDLATDEVRTALPGGPSGRRFSRWYTSDLDRWRRFEYKRLRPG